MQAQPQFLQGILAFEGQGMTLPQPLGEETFTFTVPAGFYAQPTYFRAGNSSSEMICLILRRDSIPIRFFPIGAKADSHVALAVLEDIAPGTVLDVLIAAPHGVSGYIVVDFGLLLTNHEY